MGKECASSWPLVALPKMKTHMMERRQILKTFEAHEGQTNIQMEVLENIRILFSENQELTLNKVQTVEGGKIEEEVTKGDLVEVPCVQRGDSN